VDHGQSPVRHPLRRTLYQGTGLISETATHTKFLTVPPDDLTFVVRHFLPHLNRDSIWRILRAEGLNRRRSPVSTRPARGKGAFRDYDLGFIHIDIKHLPKLQTANGERRKRYLYVAIDRRSRSVHLAVKEDETEKSAIAFLREAAAAFPFRLTNVLTDNGNCFTPAFEKVRAALGAQYRHTRPYTPQTNGMVERFNGRVGNEVLGITITPTTTSSSSSAASTPPTMPGASASWAARHPISSLPSVLRPGASSSMPNHMAEPVRMTSPRLVSSFRLPRRSHNRTAR
jgi:transposase InsO family protein